MNLLALGLLGLMLPQDAGKSVFRFDVDVRTVYVDVFISSRGRPVAGLTAGDFLVLDNGAPQPIDLVDPQSVHWSVLLLLDTSASVQGEKLEHLRAAAHAFVDGLAPEDAAGLMTFGQVWTLRERLTHDVEAIHEALDQPVEGGFTGLNDALFAGLKIVEEGSGRPMILLFTDGVDNASWLGREELLSLARESKAVINVVGIKPKRADRVTSRWGYMTLRSVGSQVKLDPAEASAYLQHLTSSTGGRAWHADTSADLSEAFLDVLRDMESRYLLSYRVPREARPGWHKLEVKLKQPREVDLRARSGYLLDPRRP